MGGSIGEFDEHKERREAAAGAPSTAAASVARSRHGFALDADGLGRAAVLTVLVFALAAGALALTRFHGAVASVWLANALVVGLVMRAPRREWPGLLALAFAAYGAANLANQEPPLLAVVLALVSITESAIVIWAMTRVFARRARFDDGFVIARFIFYAGVAAPLSAALLAAGTLALFSATPFFTTLLHWYVADALGLLTLGALLLAMREPGASVARGAWIASWAGVVVSSVATTIAFTQQSGAPLFAVAPVLMIATLRAPLTGTMAALVSSVTIAIALTLSGVGPLAAVNLDPATRSYLLQGFIASLLFVVLPVRALIGERDRLGGVIARSERLFSRIAEASPAGTIHFDPLGRPTFANHRWTEMTGLARAALAADGWLDAIDPTERSAARSLWSQVRATFEPCRREFRFLAHARPAGFAELDFYPEVEDGRVLGFVARLTDVTDRRLAEEALQEREARYRLVTENAQDVILRLGLDGCPLYVSGASLRVTGYAPAELVGRPLSERLHPDDLPVFARTLERLAAGNADAAIEFRLRHRDGHYHWFESSQRPLFDCAGAATELIASLRDIDRRRQSELRAIAAAAKLREANRLMLLAEELAGVGSWQLDTRDRALVLAPQINRILGRARGDKFLAREILAVVHPADRRALLGCLARARRRIGSVECALRVHANGVRHVRLIALAEHQRGTFAGWVGVAHDVTDKVQSEAALIAARDEAQAAALAKSHFLATMSHEIRTPMTGVLGMIDLLRDNPTPHQRDRYFAALAQSAAMLVSVVDDVLDFSKIDSGTLRLEQSDFNIESLAMATIDLFGTAASRKGLSVTFRSTCAAPALVRGDAVRLQQVLSNLLSNAIKFTERGHVTVSLASLPATPGLRYQFAIADTGIGLAADQIDHLFDPFIQADVSTSRRYGGTGLGLAISRRLVEAMGGTLEVVSTPGRGSTFTFDVTLAEGRAVDDSAHDEAHDSGHAQPLDVLVAEDNPVSQMLVAALVRRMGHHVTVVANGRDAVDAAAALRFDAILMDMQMPELDGLAATRAIRASGGPCAAIPIFALTADASAERRRFYDGAGLTDFLTKPIDRKALAARLAAIDRPVARPAGLHAVAADRHDLFDPERVEELRSALGNFRFDALLALLVSECRERPLRLRAALRRGDLAALHAEAHSLKGAASSIGADALARVAARFEQARDPAAARRLIGTLDATARATLAAANGLTSPPSDRATA